jgi:hypothetical protein
MSSKGAVAVILRDRVHVGCVPCFDGIAFESRFGRYPPPIVYTE